MTIGVGYMFFIVSTLFSGRWTVVGSYFSTWLKPPQKCEAVVFVGGKIMVVGQKWIFVKQFVFWNTWKFSTNTLPPQKTPWKKWKHLEIGEPGQQPLLLSFHQLFQPLKPAHSCLWKKGTFLGFSRKFFISSSHRQRPVVAPRRLTPVRKSRRVGLLQIKKLGPFLVVGDSFTDCNVWVNR